ncbi:hypothetical protein ACF059_31340 [Streptomyces sp. NPDC016562]|uniref:hypothetical protein n=1 Tax=Streptomyces sp. NPDC016562 TaxID=3364966 RepID=UPI00370213CD
MVGYMATPEASPLWTTLMVPVVTAIATAAAGSAGLMLQDYRRKKDIRHRHRAQMEKAHLEVQFISGWMQARTQLGPAADVSRDAEDWLDRCYQSARDASFAPPPQPSRALLRRLLLLQPLGGRAAKIFRVAYWISLAWLNYWVFWNISLLLGSTPLPLTTREMILGFLVLTAAFLGLCGSPTPLPYLR